jgi:type VI secretion system protein ImpJ
MSVHNKVVWSEGLFLQPQHFQQQDRYFEQYVEGRCRGLVPYSWGFTELEIERDWLRVGKFALRRAAGVFPDGTPFRMPEDEPVPPPLEVDSKVRDQVVFLAVPLRRADAPAVSRGDSADGLLRHDVREWEVRNVATASSEPAVLEVGALRSRFLLSSDLTQAYGCLPLAQITECRADKQVVLDDRFIPTVLRAGSAQPLDAFMKEMVGLLHQRGEALGGRVAASGRGGAAEIAQFLMLQAINRYEPVFAHCAGSGAAHPEALFRLCAETAGELATFTATSKRPPALPSYQHDRLRQSFEPLMAALRASLSAVIEQTAIPIPVEPRRFGVSVAQVPDRELYPTAYFVLAIRADAPAEEIRRRFPDQLRVGPVEKIRDLIGLALPGVPVSPLPVAPPQIPFHAGFVYFEFDQTHELWQQLKESGGIALQVAGDFSNVAMELWAIRG